MVSGPSTRKSVSSKASHHQNLWSWHSPQSWVMSHHSDQENRWISVNVANTPAVTDTALHDLIIWQLYSSIFIYVCLILAMLYFSVKYEIKDAWRVGLQLFSSLGLKASCVTPPGYSRLVCRATAFTKLVFLWWQKLWLSKESLPVLLKTPFLSRALFSSSTIW